MASSGSGGDSEIELLTLTEGNILFQKSPHTVTAGRTRTSRHTGRSRAGTLDARQLDQVTQTMSVEGFDDGSYMSPAREQCMRALNLMCCGSCRRGCCRSRRSWRFEQPGAAAQSLIAYVMLTFSVAYGLANVTLFTKAETPLSQWTVGHWLFVASRSSAKAMQMFWIIGLALAIRGLNNTINEYNFEKKQWLNWRSAHQVLMALGILFAIVHSVCHLLRMHWWQSPLLVNSTYAYYQSALGGLLLLVILLVALYYPLRSAANTKRGHASTTRRRCAQLGAKYFRFAHWQLYCVIGALIAIHSYNQFILLLWLVWSIDYFLHRVRIEDIFYVQFTRPGDGRRITALIFRTAHFSPQGVGAYYQIGLGRGSQRMWASYTAIPIDGRTVMFMLGESVFTRHLHSYLNDDINFERAVVNLDEQDELFLQSIVALRPFLQDAVLWKLPTTGHGTLRIPLQLWGSYKSNSSDVNNHSRVLVISSGIGSTVRDAIVSHQLQKRGAWQHVLCLNIMGRSPLEDADLTSLQELEQTLDRVDERDALVEHINLHCRTDSRFWFHVLQAAIPRSPLTREESTRMSPAEQQHAIDHRRYVVIVCGRAAAQLVQHAIDYHEKNQRISPEQLNYIHIEGFR